MRETWQNRRVEAVEKLHDAAELCEALDLAIKGADSDCERPLRELVRTIDMKVMEAIEAVEALR